MSLWSFQNQVDLFSKIQKSEGHQMTFSLVLSLWSCIRTWGGKKRKGAIRNYFCNQMVTFYPPAIVLQSSYNGRQKLDQTPDFHTRLSHKGTFCSGRQLTVAFPWVLIHLKSCKTVESSMLCPRRIIKTRRYSLVRYCSIWKYQNQKILLGKILQCVYGLPFWTGLTPPLAGISIKRVFLLFVWGFFCCCCFFKIQVYFCRTSC